VENNAIDYRLQSIVNNTALGLEIDSEKSSIIETNRYSIKEKRYAIKEIVLKRFW